MLSNFEETDPLTIGKSLEAGSGIPLDLKQKAMMDFKADGFMNMIKEQRNPSLISKSKREQIRKIIQTVKNHCVMTFKWLWVLFAIVGLLYIAYLLKRES